VRQSVYGLLAVIRIVLAYQFIIKPANIALNNMARGNDAEESKWSLLESPQQILTIVGSISLRGETRHE
jgi:hypothetical protein